MNFLIKIIFAAKTFSPDMLKTFAAALSFIQQMTAPLKIDTALGVTIFHTHHMIDGDAMLEFFMPGRIAFENIQSFIWIYHNNKKKFQKNQ